MQCQPGTLHYRLFHYTTISHSSLLPPWRRWSGIFTLHRKLLQTWFCLPPRYRQHDLFVYKQDQSLFSPTKRKFSYVSRTIHSQPAMFWQLLIAVIINAHPFLLEYFQLIKFVHNFTTLKKRCMILLLSSYLWPILKISTEVIASCKILFHCFQGCCRSQATNELYVCIEDKWLYLRCPMKDSIIFLHGKRVSSM